MMFFLDGILTFLVEKTYSLISLAVTPLSTYAAQLLFFCSIIIVSIIMKSSTIALLTAATALASFGPSSLAFQATLPQQRHSSSSTTTTTTLYEYIPSGFNKQTWAAFKKKEAEAKKAKNLGKDINTTPSSIYICICFSQTIEQEHSYVRHSFLYITIR